MVQYGTFHKAQVQGSGQYLQPTTPLAYPASAHQGGHGNALVPAPQHAQVTTQQPAALLSLAGSNMVYVWGTPVSPQSRASAPCTSLLVRLYGRPPALAPHMHVHADDAAQQPGAVQLGRQGLGGGAEGGAEGQGWLACWETVEVSQSGLVILASQHQFSLPAAWTADWAVLRNARPSNRVCKRFTAAVGVHKRAAPEHTRGCWWLSGGTSRVPPSCLALPGAAPALPGTPAHLLLRAAEHHVGDALGGSQPWVHGQPNLGGGERSDRRWAKRH